MYKKLSAWLISVTLVALFLGGCVTAKEVSEIVEDSNRQIVEASVRDREIVVARLRASTVAAIAGSGAHLDPEPGVDAAWQEAVARIEDFIGNHPDETRTNNALRIREAVVLFNAGKPNLARAVFAEVDRDLLGNKRDRAIYDVREHLIWWYGVGSMSNADKVSASSAIAGLALDGCTLEQKEDICRYLEETRVRIALRLAQTFRDGARVKAVLDEPVNSYRDQFNSSQQKEIQAWHMDQDHGDGTTLRSLRWYNYVLTVFEDADALIGRLCPECEKYTPDWVSCIKNQPCE